MPRRNFTVNINPVESGKQLADFYFESLFVKSADVSTSNPQILSIEFEDTQKSSKFWVYRILLGDADDGNVINWTSKDLVMSARFNWTEPKMYGDVSAEDQLAIKQCVQQCLDILLSPEIKHFVDSTENHNYVGWDGGIKAKDYLPNGIKRTQITLDAGKDTFEIVSKLAKSFKVFSHTFDAWINAVAYVEKSLAEGKKITRIVELILHIGSTNRSDGLAPWLLNNYAYFNIPVTEEEYGEITEIISEFKQKQMAANLTKAAKRLTN